MFVMSIKCTKTGDIFSSTKWKSTMFCSSINANEFWVIFRTCYRKQKKISVNEFLTIKQENVCGFKKWASPRVYNKKDKVYYSSRNAVDWTSLAAGMIFRKNKITCWSTTKGCKKYTGSQSQSCVKGLSNVYTEVIQVTFQERVREEELHWKK